MKTFRTIIALATVAHCAATMPTAQAQSYLLDDDPQTPLLGFVGFGSGAESPWGFPTAPGSPSAPSPILPGIVGVVAGDGDIIGPGLTSIGAPGLPYIGSLSDSANPGSGGFLYHLYFSADRVSVGAAGSALNGQTALNQQPGDIFRGGSIFASPATVIGAMAALPAPFAGVLPTVNTPIGSNVLILDESRLGLPADATNALLSATVPAMALANGTHNNIDGFDFSTIATAGIFTAQTYHTAYPDETFPFGIPTADVFDIAPGSTTFCGFPAFAATATMGLGFGDVIDAMVVFDNGAQGSVACGGPGAQAGLDGILFSLAPGSPSLRQTGRSPGDVFFSDFSGNFGVFADARQLGVRANAGGSPAASLDNVDALEFGCLGDLDLNGVVNFSDVILASNCSTTSNCADFNLDGVTNAIDFNILASNFNCTGG
ncbi:MAG: hypothetical protein AB8G16_13325 [Gammaproteobacteria bacterium]